MGFWGSCSLCTGCFLPLLVMYSQRAPFSNVFSAWSLHRAPKLYQLKLKCVIDQSNDKKKILKLKYPLKYRENNFTKYLCFAVSLSHCLGLLESMLFFSVGLKKGIIFRDVIFWCGP